MYKNALTGPRGGYVKPHGRPGALDNGPNPAQREAAQRYASRIEAERQRQRELLAKRGAASG